MVNYQGNTNRRDFVGFLLIFWFLARYYPYLSGGLIVCMMVSTFWEKSINGADIIVKYFTGNVKEKAGHLEQNIKMASTAITIDDPNQKEN